MNISATEVALPCLRGKMGDTFFYSTLVTLEEVSNRIKLPEEIDEKYASNELRLGDWIQRKIQKDRINNIAMYLKTQEQRFFNSIIVGIFDGNPSWQDISIKNPEISDLLTEDTVESLNRTFGILTLDGTESLFAIDGQHRIIGIRQAVKQKSDIAGDEISIIFIAHKSDEDGKIRTRRLFSTLNKYAKPVSQSEIIALSEDNNCAIITRDLIDRFDLFKGKVLVNKNRSISADNTDAFTNIMILYDIVERILTDKKVYGIAVSGHDKNSYITNRKSEDQLDKDFKKCEKILTDVLKRIPSVNEFFETAGKLNRKNKNTSLLFRPIGQVLLFDVYKVALEHKKGRDAISFFAKDDFNLANKHWRKIFLDPETKTISSEKARQRFATLLILDSLSIPITRTVNDNKLVTRFRIDPASI